MGGGVCGEGSLICFEAGLVLRVSALVLGFAVCAHIYESECFYSAWLEHTQNTPFCIAENNLFWPNSGKVK